jgi:hypothetical protein
VTSTLTLRPLVVNDAPFLASLQADPVFAAHAGWRHITAITDGEGWWRESIAVPDPALLRLLETFLGTSSHYDRYEILRRS